MTQWRKWTARSTIWTGALEMLYPRQCAGCGWRGVWLCDRCLEEQPLFERPWCFRCGIPLHQHCRCGFIESDIIQVRSAGPYEGWLKQAIQRIKYRGERARIPSLVALMPRLIDDPLKYDAIVAVPLHSERLRERGFNQSDLLAQNLAASVGSPVFDHLIRVRHTEHQVGLPSHERAENVKNAFAVNGNAPRSLLLVDDVVTTGATLNACQQALVRAGASSVDMITLA